MKKIALVATLALITACTPAAETDAPAEATATTTEAAATVVTAADGGTSHGKFRITDADGKISMEEVREDGTWTSTNADGEVTTGTWKQPSTNLYCVTADTEGATEVCHEESIDETGAWTTRDPTDGTVSTIERVEA